MKLSTRARYAIRAMVHIARNGENGHPVNLSFIAARASISRRYLEQLVIPLKNANLIKAVRGKHGGYILAKPPEDTKIGEIVQASIGPINIVDCVNDPESCMDAERCDCRPLYKMINERIVDAMNRFSLADLVDSAVNTGKSGLRIEAQADEKPAGSALTPDQQALKEEVESMLGTADPEALQKIAEMLRRRDAP